MEAPTQEVKKLAAEIGLFFLHKNEEDYAKTRQEIQNMGITRLEIKMLPNRKNDGNPSRLFIEKCLEITLARPGLIIGPKGRLITELQEHLNSLDEPISLRIVEEEHRIECYIIPYEYDYSDYS